MEKSQELLQVLKTLTILYIEDEDAIRNEMTKVLQLLTKEVFAYSNAKDGYKGYTQKKPDMILSDISLGGESGIEFSKKVRTIDKQIPIILLSAHTDTSYLLDAARLKLVAYLTKPINFGFTNLIQFLMSSSFPKGK